MGEGGQRGSAFGFTDRHEQFCCIFGSRGIVDEDDFVRLAAVVRGPRSEKKKGAWGVCGCAYISLGAYIFLVVLPTACEGQWRYSRSLIFIFILLALSGSLKNVLVSSEGLLSPAKTK